MHPVLMQECFFFGGYFCFVVDDDVPVSFAAIQLKMYLLYAIAVIWPGNGKTIKYEWQMWNGALGTSEMTA